MAKKTEAKPAAKSAKPKAAAKKSKRQKWFDPKGPTSLINGYAKQMKSFLAALADGKIDDDEIKVQERKLISLMKEIEPKLDDETHAKVTQLLCELTVFDIMQMMYGMEESRPTTAFRG